MKKFAISFIALSGSLSVAQAAAIFAPGDTVFGGQLNGANFEQGVVGTTAGVNNWPAGEPPTMAIDGVGQKYLNFAELNTGIVVTPSAGASIATSMTLWTANDAVPRDPASYAIYGTNTILGAAPFALANFSLISSGALALPDTRNLGAGNPLLPANSQTIVFANATSYTSYMVVFPTVKDAAAANSMQIAEIQLDGVLVPEPGSVSLLALGLGMCLLRRKRR